MLDPTIEGLPPRTPFEELKKKVHDQEWEIERLRMEIRRLKDVIEEVRDTCR